MSSGTITQTGDSLESLTDEAAVPGFILESILKYGAGIFVLGLAVLYIFTAVQPWFDDVFITLSYSQNLATGRGMVFQNDSRILGVTTVIWCWLNALCFWVSPGSIHSSIPCSMLFSASIFIAALSIARCGLRQGWNTGAWAGAIFFVLRPDQMWIYGSETALAVALGCESLLAWHSRRYCIAGSLIACLVLTRPEALVLMLEIVCVQLFFQRNKRAAFHLGATFAALLLPVLFLLTWYFGSPIPNTLAAKRAQLASPEIHFLPAAGGAAIHIWDQIKAAPVLSTVMYVFGLFRLYVGIRKKGVKYHALTFMLIGWPIIHLLSLTVMRMPHYMWYDYPVWVGQSILLSAGCQFLVEAVRSRGRARNTKRLGLPELAAFACIAAVVLSTAPKWYGDAARGQRERYEGYEKLAYAVNRKAGRNDLVLAQEIGTLRFFMQPEILIVDAYFLTRPVPQSGRVPSQFSLLAEIQPRFWVDSHLGKAQLVLMDSGNNYHVVRKGFDLWVSGPERTGLKYTAREVLTDKYGVRVLYEKTSARPVPY